MVLEWTEQARQDLEEIFQYYDTLSHKVAILYSEELLKAGDRLRRMPEMGPKEPELEHLKRNYRYVLVLRTYKLIYLYENEVCSILMVWDCRQNPKLMRDSDRFESPNPKIN